MKVRPTKPRCALEQLESRRLFTTSFGEVEPNGTSGQASSVGAGQGQTIALWGNSFGTGDLDHFRYFSSRAEALTVRVNVSGSRSLLTVSTNGVVLLSTNNSGTLYTAANRSYLFMIRSADSGLSRYSVTIGPAATGSTVPPTTTPTNPSTPPQSSSGSRLNFVPDARYARLGKGVNIPSWFWNQYGPDLEGQQRRYIQQTDVDRLKALGVRHVRIPIESDYMYDWNRPDQLRTQYLDELDAGIRLFLRNDVAVIVSPFGQYNQRALTNPDSVARFMRVFAGFMSQYDPNRLFIQTANEPEGTPGTWWFTQYRVIQAIRERAPGHTIIGTTTLKFGPGWDNWGTVNALTQVNPYTDERNIVYGFHFYEPFPFTHQGAFWASPGYASLYDLPYPSTPENVAPIVDRLRREGNWTVAEQVRAYGNQRWNSERVRARIGEVGAWARRNGVRVIADEFGVFAEGGVQGFSRDTYLRDVRVALESNGFGWSMWDFADGFGLFGGTTTSTRWVRRGTAQALGLFV
jgi:endoglucanase